MFVSFRFQLDRHRLGFVRHNFSTQYLRQPSTAPLGPKNIFLKIFIFISGDPKLTPIIVICRLRLTSLILDQTENGRKFEAEKRGRQPRQSGRVLQGVDGRTGHTYKGFF